MSRIDTTGFLDRMTKKVRVEQQYRKDGWPLCPRCGEEELYSLVMLRYDGRGKEPTLDDCFKGEFGCYACHWTGKVERQEVKRWK